MLILKSGNPNEKQIIVKLAHNMGKFDIKEYFTKVYNMKVLKVNTVNYDAVKSKTRKGNLIEIDLILLTYQDM